MKPNQKYSIDKINLVKFLESKVGGSISSITKAKNGAASQVYIFETESGDRQVVRLSPIYSWQNYEEGLEFKSRLIDEVGFPTPRSLAAGVCSIKNQDYKFEIVEFLDGEELSLYNNQQHFRDIKFQNKMNKQIGELVFKLHSLPIAKFGDKRQGFYAKFTLH